MIKSICPVQVGGQGWDVRVRYTDGREQFLLGTGGYTFAQAQTAAQSMRRDLAGQAEARSCK